MVDAIPTIVNCDIPTWDAPAKHPLPKCRDVKRTLMADEVPKKELKNQNQIVSCALGKT